VTIEQPASGEPRRPLGPRDPGDAWVVAPTGERYWGRFGAAGLLAVDPERGVLLQHRVAWSHHGDTWGLPGGARHEGESAVAGALRESAEEAGVPDAAIRPRLLSVLDLGYWSYATLVGDVAEPFEPEITDPESRALEWVPVAEVSQRPLHPGFAASWERLAALFSVRPAVVVDVANVVGSVPDGWWRDRAGATSRMIQSLAGLAVRGVAGSTLGLPEDVWFPEWVGVVEGAARAVLDGESGAVFVGASPPGELGSRAMAPALEVVPAAASGDDAIAARAVELVAAGRTVTVVTSDRGLAARVTDAGADVRGAGWLRDLL
jgi:8-oxo-dGTP pyrophosphatase MutT (NUDIX family)